MQTRLRLAFAACRGRNRLFRKKMQKKGQIDKTFGTGPPRAASVIAFRFLSEARHGGRAGKALLPI